RARADVELEPALGEQARLRVEGMAGLVAPGQRDGALRQLAHELRLLDDDVAPELHALAARADARVHGAQEVEVDVVLAAPLALRARATEAQVEGLVQPDVELAAREVRQELVVEVLEQRQAPGIERTEREGLLVDRKG